MWKTLLPGDDIDAGGLKPWPIGETKNPEINALKKPQKTSLNLKVGKMSKKSETNNSKKLENLAKCWQKSVWKLEKCPKIWKKNWELENSKKIGKCWKMLTKPNLKVGKIWKLENIFLICMSWHCVTAVSKSSGSLN